MIDTSLVVQREEFEIVSAWLTKMCAEQHVKSDFEGGDGKTAVNRLGDIVNASALLKRQGDAADTVFTSCRIAVGVM